MFIIVQGSVCTEKHIVWRGFTVWLTGLQLKCQSFLFKKKKALQRIPPCNSPTNNLFICVQACKWKNETLGDHMLEIFCIQRNMAEKVWTMIRYRQGHSRLIIWQFRTVHFLVNILFSGKNLCLVPLCLIIGACVNLGQRTGVADEQHLPPLASVSSSPGVSFAGTQCGGGWKWRMKRRVLMRAGTA